jgi:hypothetical protein
VNRRLASARFAAIRFRHDRGNELASLRFCHARLDGQATWSLAAASMCWFGQEANRLARSATPMGNIFLLVNSETLLGHLLVTRVQISSRHEYLKKDCRNRKNAAKIRN